MSERKPTLWLCSNFGIKKYASYNFVLLVQNYFGYFGPLLT